ncbi:glycosyltransferase [Specibacter cremeus]|uniref:glycosyltransferase n=1 Tax=Specibacter cremeus TaxID=1629051 RepID=UPI000F76B8EC|nr:glycosyltransferase [Specibacter cremeus]
MKPTIDHVLLTRFNLPTPGVESLVRAKEGWLRDRQQLFERYCLPAVLGQTVTGFSWIIYFDTQSPPWLKERVADLSSDGSFTPLYRDSVPRWQLLADLRAVTGAGADILLTTNVDNDDAVSLDFVERIQQQAVDGNRCAIYLAHGLIRAGDELFRRRDDHNAFVSVGESWTDPVTCWADWHNRLGETMAVRSVGGPPAWLQVVHGGNVSNRVRGTRVRPEPFRDLFVHGLDGVTAPTRRAMAVDLAIRAPMRGGRELARAIVKKAVLRVGGKQGLNRIKVLAAGRSRVE